MIRVLLIRAVLLALPFAVWFAWRAWARRRGRTMGATPWAWLLAVGLALVGVSLLATAAFNEDNRGKVYVPGEAMPDGSVSKGRFEAVK